MVLPKLLTVVPPTLGWKIWKFESRFNEKKQKNGSLRFPIPWSIKNCNHCITLFLHTPRQPSSASSSHHRSHQGSVEFEPLGPCDTWKLVGEGEQWNRNGHEFHFPSKELHELGKTQASGRIIKATHIELTSPPKAPMNSAGFFQKHPKTQMRTPTSKLRRLCEKYVPCPPRLTTER